MVLGVFLGPLTEFWSLQGSSKSFGLALLLYVGHCFALAGHDDLFNRRTTRSMLYCPLQEKVALAFVATFAVAYIVWAIRA